ncbi:MAG: hypothetical protein RDV41_07755 [Planctomycetota bacterium]|nr:hypothetical protein [Planctomycetota bacterium]
MRAVRCECGKGGVVLLFLASLLGLCLSGVGRPVEAQQPGPGPNWETDDTNHPSGPAGVPGFSWKWHLKKTGTTIEVEPYTTAAVGGEPMDQSAYRSLPERAKGAHTLAWMRMYAYHPSGPQQNPAPPIPFFECEDVVNYGQAVVIWAEFRQANFGAGRSVRPNFIQLKKEDSDVPTAPKIKDKAFIVDGYPLPVQQPGQPPVYGNPTYPGTFDLFYGGQYLGIFMIDMPGMSHHAPTGLPGGDYKMKVDFQTWLFMIHTRPEGSVPCDEHKLGGMFECGFDRHFKLDGVQLNKIQVSKFTFHSWSDNLSQYKNDYKPELGKTIWSDPDPETELPPFWVYLVQ